MSNAPGSPRKPVKRPRAKRALQPYALFQTLVVAASVGFFATVVVVAHLEPDYFQDRLLAVMQHGPDLDPMTTAATEGPAEASGIEALPVPAAPVRDLAPEDYQIVMIFGDEAHIASPDQLLRVQVGSEVPGLGRILAIEPGEAGGRIEAERATLVGQIR